MNEPITQFDGEYRWLSNFWPCTIRVLVGEDREEMTFQCVEAAYQAAKTLDRAVKREFQALNGAQSKRRGRTVVLHAFWTPDNKLWMMRGCLAQKFARGTELAAKLVATHPRPLVEGNWWHDNFWGHCSCGNCAQHEHHNWLGRLLMERRSQLMEEENDA